MTTKPLALYIASGNPGKLRDFAVAAQEHRPSVDLRPIPGLAEIPAPQETAATFEGNARAKAIYYSTHAPNLLVIADDSGLEVDALNGAPGVYSARYAERAGLARTPGHPADEDTHNNRHLLAELARVLGPQALFSDAAHRTARYRCVLAAAREGQVFATADGTLEGRILLAPQGAGGFGYDPLFYLPQLGHTMAEIDEPTRLTRSHRGQAFRALLTILSSRHS